jgi:hypothetical protein
LLVLFGTEIGSGTLPIMKAAHSAQQYRNLASQCIERAQFAATNSERLYFIEQAAVWHRLAAARQDDGAAECFPPKKALNDSHKNHVD